MDGGSLSILGLALVLGATLAYSSVDLVRKMAAERMPLLPLMFWMAIGAVPLFAVWWWWLGALPPSQGYWLPGLASGVLNIFANLALLRAMQLGELSAVVPLLSLTPVLTTLFSVFLLGEIPTLQQWVGTVLVVVGALLLQTDGAQSDLALRSQHRQAALCMVVVVIGWSAAMPLDKLAAAAADTPFHGAVLHLMTAVAPLVYLVARREGAALGAVRHHLTLVVLLTAFGFVALAFQLSALQYVYAGFVETIKRGIASPLSLVLGAMFFGEVIRRRKVGAIALMVVGIALVLL